ncbi:hypothetical protein AOQ84DRAFT_382712 [Glonium stellatum]|uniref:RING-type domain-containing protein n=1 Tax=Glonium stellatum TaxID=574774 RepID=A0A8E2JMD2_9PEZI|nr:hypothetical protein AOQ84DRAFT_382712 [Glonium stellatum]
MHAKAQASTSTSIAHHFRGGGSRLLPHHFTTYVYPDLGLVRLTGHNYYLSQPHGIRQRQNPGPKPQNPEDCSYFTITELPWASMNTTLGALAEADKAYNGESLRDAMDRVSKYSGTTRLGMIWYREQNAHRYNISILVSRKTSIGNISPEFPFRVFENVLYKFSTEQWQDMARLPRDDPLWRQNLECLRHMKTDRAFHCVQWALEPFQEWERHARHWSSWLPPELDSFISSVALEDLPDDEDRRCNICIVDFEPNGDELPVKLRCGHIFGHKCILGWVGKDLSRPCPLCRRKLLEPSVPRAFKDDDPIVIVRASAMGESYRKILEDAKNDNYSEKQFNPAFCPEAAIMEKVFSEHLDSVNGYRFLPRELYNQLQLLVSRKLLQSSQDVEGRLLGQVPLFPGFKTFLNETCKKMVFALLDNQVEENRAALNRAQNNNFWRPHVLEEDSEDEIL